MSDVTNLKTITNQLFYPLTVKNGENPQQTFTVGQGSGWNGDMWIPWVFGPETMGKSILMEAPEFKVYIFQHGDRIWWSPDWDFHHHKLIIDGESYIRGEKGLIIEANRHMYLV